MSETVPPLDLPGQLAHAVVDLGLESSDVVAKFAYTCENESKAGVADVNFLLLPLSRIFCFIWLSLLSLLVFVGCCLVGAGSDVVEYSVRQSESGLPPPDWEALK